MTKLDGLVKPFIGQVCWQTGGGYGTYATLDFGEHIKVTNPKSKHLKEYEKGSWVLSPHFGVWALYADKNQLVWCYDDPLVIREKIKVLKGKKILDVRFNKPIERSMLIFDGGCRIMFALSKQAREEDAAAWWLFTPDETVLCVGPGDKWTYERVGVRHSTNLTFDPLKRELEHIGDPHIPYEDMLDIARNV